MLSSKLDINEWYVAIKSSFINIYMCVFEGVTATDFVSHDLLTLPLSISTSPTQQQPSLTIIGELSRDAIS